MTIGVSIVHFMIKVPKLVQMTIPYIEYTLIKYPLSIQDGRQRSKMAATKFSVFDILTSDGGDSRASSWSLCYYYYFFALSNPLLLYTLFTSPCDRTISIIFKHAFINSTSKNARHCTEFWATIISSQTYPFFQRLLKSTSSLKMDLIRNKL